MRPVDYDRLRRLARDAALAELRRCADVRVNEAIDGCIAHAERELNLTRADARPVVLASLAQAWADFRHEIDHASDPAGEPHAR